MPLALYEVISESARRSDLGVEDEILQALNDRYVTLLEIGDRVAILNFLLDAIDQESASSGSKSKIFRILSEIREDAKRDLKPR